MFVLSKDGQAFIKTLLVYLLNVSFIDLIYFSKLTTHFVLIWIKASVLKNTGGGETSIWREALIWRGR